MQNHFTTDSRPVFDYMETLLRSSHVGISKVHDLSKFFLIEHEIKMHLKIDGVLNLMKDIIF